MYQFFAHWDLVTDEYVKRKTFLRKTVVSDAHPWSTNVSDNHTWSFDDELEQNRIDVRARR